MLNTISDKITGRAVIPNKGLDNREISSRIFISGQHIVRFITIIALLLLGANILGFVLEAVLPKGSLLAAFVFKYFNFDRERNIPAYFSTVLLLFIAALLFLTYLLKSNGRKIKGATNWLFLSLTFLFLSIDENIQIHEVIGRFVKKMLPQDFADYVLWAWVLPYIILFIGIAAYFGKFVLSLPGQTRNLFILSGFLYIAGAVGFDILQGHFHSDFVYNRIFYSMEESMEMGCAILFIHALLQYLTKHKAQLVLVNKAGGEF